jgi:hypothetical protein
MMGGHSQALLGSAMPASELEEQTPDVIEESIAKAAHCCAPMVVWTVLALIIASYELHYWSV